MTTIVHGILKRESSSSGRAYVSIDVPRSKLASYLDAMRTYVGDILFISYTSKKWKRDGREFHVTVVAPNEMQLVDQQSLDGSLGCTFELELKGLGRVRHRSDEVYYVVVHCPQANTLRELLGLPHRDLHVTLGFSRKDIHDAKKDEETILTGDL